MATVHFHCDHLPEVGGNLKASGYVHFLMGLTGESIDSCIDLYDFIRRATGGAFDHLSHEKYGPFECVVEVVRHKGGRYRDVSGMDNGYTHCPVYEDVTATILFYAPGNAAWHLAKVTAEADRPCNHFGGLEWKKWITDALLVIYPQLSHSIKH